MIGCLMRAWNMSWKKYIFAKEKEPRHFRLDKDGNLTFYPLGHPGECFLITKKLQQKITLFFAVFLISFAVFHFGIFAAHKFDYISLYAASWIHRVEFVVWPAWYFYRMFKFTKSLEPAECGTQAKPFFNYVILFAILIELVTMYCAAYVLYPVSSIMAVPALIASTILLMVYFYIFYFSITCNARFFTKLHSKH